MTIKKRTITSFISSVNRVSNEYAYNFTIDYPDGILSCEQQENGCVFLLPLKNLLWAKLRDYTISRVKPNPRQAFLLQVVKLR